MPPKKKRNVLISVSLLGEVSIQNLLDWIITLLLGGILCFNIFQLGGVRAETQLISVCMCAALLILHGLWYAISPQRDGYVIQRNALLLVPFALYAVLHWLVFSPVPWAARGDMIMVLEAFVIFWVAAHNLRRRQQIWLLFAMVCFFAAFTILPAFNQAMRRPNWGPPVINPINGHRHAVKLSEVFWGQAAGTMGSPGAFGGLMLLMVGPMLVGGLSRRLSFPVRTLCLFLALLGVYGTILTQSLPAILAMMAVLLLVPVVLVRRPRRRLLALVFAMVVPLLGVGYLYLSKPGFREVANLLLQGEYNDPRLVLWGAALNGFLAHPVLGQGMSAFGWVFEQFRPEGFNYSPLYAHNAYLNFLADFGVVGVLCILPVLFILVKAVRTLRGVPEFVVLEYPRRRKITPNRRMALAGLLMSFTGFGLLLFFEFNLRVPALLFIVAAYLGVMVKYLPTHEYAVRVSKAKGLGWIVACGVAAVLFVSFSSQYLLAQAYGFEGQRLVEQSNELMQERERPDALALEDAITFSRKAVDLEPGNPAYQTTLARAILNQAMLWPSQHTEYGQEASEHAQLAVERSPDYLTGWIALGLAEWMAGDYAASGHALHQATVCAPNNAQAWYYYSAYLNIDPTTRDDALMAVERSLVLDADNAPAESLRTKILIP